MNYLDPREQPNQWLGEVLKNLLKTAVEVKNAESIELLEFAHKQLALWIDPGILSSVFSDWIEDYVDEMEAQQKPVSTEEMTETCT
jgi:hypothetical protein